MKTADDAPRLGAVTDPKGGVHFRLWTDKGTRAAVVLFDDDGGPTWEEPMALDPNEPHVFNLFLERAEVGSLYKLKLDGELLSDPCARCLPYGPHGPARVVGPRKPAAYPKRRVQFDRGEVIYELHVGAFTPEGTFAAAQGRLAHLKDLGVTVIELMPIASFPGERGWGYDGVAMFAPFAGYGSTAELAELIDAVHREGMSIVLDVVFNHLGPDGNPLPNFSDRYFHPERKNPWGAAPAFEDTPFRRLILDCARYWLHEVGFDGLRLDAVHELEPGGDPHILKELAAVARSCSPPAVLIAEDDRNDPEMTLGHGADAVWSDDFHHSLHVLLTGERDGYYAAYEGTLAELSRIILRGQLYEGQLFSPTGAARGKPALNVPRQRLVYSLQNHDQVGNRAQGERLSSLVGPTQLRSALLLLAFLPATPMFFMGEEWGVATPFLYFTDHAEPLGSAVTEGRRAEFAHFSAFSGGTASVPDPQAADSFERSRLPANLETGEAAGQLRAFYRELLTLRRHINESGALTLDSGVVGDVLWVARRVPGTTRGWLCLFNAGEAVELDSVAGCSPQNARAMLSSSEGVAGFSLPTAAACFYALS